MSRFYLNAQLNLQAPTSANVNAVLRTLRQQVGAGVNIPVNVNIPNNLQQQLKNINQSLNTATKAGQSAASSIEEFGKQAARSIRHFGAFTVATTAFINLIGAIRKGVSDAIEFDHQMVRISQVTGQSVKTLSSLRNEITRVAKSTGVTAESLAEVAVTLAQAGISARDTAKALDTLAKTELAATFGDIRDTTEASIAIIRQFGITTEQLESKLGSVNRVAAAFAVEAEDITAAVKRAGGAFSAAGGSFEEFISLFTSVRQTTRESAETIATGFRTIFTRIQRVRTQDALQRLGIQLRFTREEAVKLNDVGLTNQFVGPYEAVKRLSSALNQLRGTDPRFAQIVEELGGFRQISKVIPLVQQFGVAQKALNIAIAGGNSLNKDFITAQQALAVQLSKVREEFSALIRKISENQQFRSLLSLMLKMASAAIKLVDALEPIIPLIGVFGAISAGKGTSTFLKSVKSNLFQFNSGGLVPGRGPNKDTVPATLTKGEYVIRRQAVDKIGVNNLDKMNRTGFAIGGPVDKNSTTDNIIKQLRNAVSGKRGTASTQAMLEIFSKHNIRLPGSEGEVSTRLGKLRKNLDNPAKAGDSFNALVNPTGPTQKVKKTGTLSIGSSTQPYFGGYFLRRGKNAAGADTEIGGVNINRDSYGGFDDMIANLEKKNPGLRGKLGGINQLRIPLDLSVINKRAGNLIQGRMRKGFTNLIYSTASKLGEPLLKPFSGNYSRLPLDSIAGVGFEGVLASFEREPFDAGDSKQTFDFPNGASIPLFPNAKPGVARDAKLTLSKSAVSAKGKGSIKDKIAAVLSGRSAQSQSILSKIKIPGFNSGGAASDTVPAMLTPGEYVINKKAAAKLGRPTLDKMNQVKGFASGGPVGGGGRFSGGLGEGFNLFSLLTALGAVTSTLTELNPAAKEVIDTFSGAAAQFIILKSAINTIPFDGLASKATLATKGFGSAIKSLGLFTIAVGNAARNAAIGPPGSFSGNFRTRPSAGARGVADAIFQRSVAAGEYDRAGRAFAAGKGFGPGTIFNGIARNIGRGKAIQQSGKADLLRATLAGNSDAISLAQQKIRSGGLINSLRGGVGSGLKVKPTLGGIATVGTAGVLAAGAITNLREDRARKRIAAGDLGGAKDLQNASLQGGIASGAIGLGAVGAAVGGPIGAAVGAVVGAGAAFATEFKGVNDVLRTVSAGMIDLKTSAEKAATAVNEFGIESRGNKISQNVKALGLAGSAGERAKFAGDISRDFQKNVRLTASNDEETRQKAIEAVSNNATDLRSAIETSIGKGDVGNLEQLFSRFGTNNISTLAQVEGLNIDLLSKEFKGLIEAQSNARKVQVIYTQAQLETLRQFNQLKTLNVVINDSIAKFNQLNGTLSAFEEGKITVPDFSSIFEEAAKGQLSGATGGIFNNLLGRVGGLGPGGARVSEGARAEAIALNSLDKIIQDALQSRGGSEFDDELDAKAAFDEALRNNLRGQGVGDATINGIAQRFGDVLVGLSKQENSQSNLATALSPENRGALFDALSQKAINIQGAQDLIGKAVNQQRAIQDLTNKRLSIEQEFTENLNQIVGTRAEAEKTLAVILGRGQDKRSLGQRNAFADQRLNNILTGTGLNAGSGAQAVTQTNLAARNRLAGIQGQIEAGANPLAFANETENLQRIIQRTGQALDEMAKSTDKLSNTQEELARLEQERSARFGVARNFTFGSNEERAQIAKQTASVAKFVSSGFDTKLLDNEKFRQNLGGGLEALRGTGIKFQDGRGGTLGIDEIERQAVRGQGFGAGVTDFSPFEKQNIDLLKSQYDELRLAREGIQAIASARIGANANVAGQAVGFATGGLVGGVGNSDSVSALLTPGEFVMRKDAVSRIGLNNLAALNNGKRRFADGGLVTPNTNITITGLDSSVSKFVAATNTLAQTLSTFPSEITGSFTVRHEHIFNGVEVFSRMEPIFREVATKLIEEKLQKFVSDKLPDLGRL